MEKEYNEVFKLHNYLNVEGALEEIIEKIIMDIPNSDDIGFAFYLQRKFP